MRPVPFSPVPAVPLAPVPAVPQGGARFGYPDPVLPPGTRAARVLRVDRGRWDLLTDAGALRVAALPAPALARDAATVGDWVTLEGDRPVALLPRTTLLARGSASADSAVQPLAANVDVVLICAGLQAAAPVRRVERLLTLAWDSGAAPVVVLTKADLCDDVGAAVERVARHAPGVPVAVVTAATGDVAALAPYVVPGTTLVLLGASGAGKSTLVNALAGREVMATGDNREVDGKGRHTTTHRELLVLASGAVVIDTPGLRAVALQGGTEALAQAFSDVAELAVACRFADCAHQGEPGCAVLASVEAGDLPVERVDAWRHLQRELARQARRADRRLQSEEKRRWKARRPARTARP